MANLRPFVAIVKLRGSSRLLRALGFSDAKLMARDIGFLCSVRDLVEGVLGTCAYICKTTATRSAAATFGSWGIRATLLAVFCSQGPVGEVAD